MQLRLSPRTLDRLDAQRHGSLLGFTSTSMEADIVSAFRGQMPAEMHSKIRQTAISGKLRIDNVSAALIAHMGLSPAFLAMLEHVIGSAEVIDIDEEVERATMVTITDEGAKVVISKDPGVVWNSRNHTLMLPALPEQILAICLHRPVTHIVSHPALDGQDLKVVGRLSLRGTTVLTVSGRRWLSGGEIAKLLEPHH